MKVPSRSRRRHDRRRMRRRMERIWKFWGYSGDPPLDWIGVMLSTHGKPCSCSLGCGNRRRWDGATRAEMIAGSWSDPIA